MTPAELEDLAEAHAARGELDEARALYEAALAGPDLDEPTRTRITLRLAAKERMAGELDAAEARARAIVETTPEGTLAAHARLELGSTLVERSARTADASEALAHLERGLGALGEAAAQYEAADRPERFACYVTMAEALTAASPDAALALFHRTVVATERAEGRWMGLVRFRALRGMAMAHLAAGRTTDARPWLEAATQALLEATSSADPERRARLLELADVFEDRVADAPIAEALRRRARGRLD